MKTAFHIIAAFAAFAFALAALAHAQAGTTDPQETIITSEGPLQMRNDGVEAYFVMTDNVRLVGTNIEVTCDKLEVFAETKKEEKDAGNFSGISGIRRVLATGHVVIMQEGRRATAGRAEVLPQENKIVLTEEPVVTDPQGTVAGSKIEIFRGEQNATVYDPRLLFRALPNLGFPRRPGEEAAPEESASGAPAPEAPEPENAAEDSAPAPVEP
ncbi:MAG: LptA/OstA family protein [Opitutaceae bacterium]